MIQWFKRQYRRFYYWRHPERALPSYLTLPNFCRKVDLPGKSDSPIKFVRFERLPPEER